MNNEKFIYYLLHGKPFGRVLLERPKGEILFSYRLPGDEDKRFIRVGEEDYRFLVIFDGELLFHSCPPGLEIVSVEQLGDISCHSSSMRNVSSEYKWTGKPEYRREGDKAKLALSRIVMRLPSCELIARRYNQRLDTVYGIIRPITNPAGERTVEWELIFR